MKSRSWKSLAVSVAERGRSGSKNSDASRESWSMDDMSGEFIRGGSVSRRRHSRDNGLDGRVVNGRIKARDTLGTHMHRL